MGKLPNIVDFKEREEIVPDVLRGKGIRRPVSMVFGAEADKLVFTEGFQHSVDTPDKNLPVLRVDTVKAPTVKNQGECIIRVRKL